MGPANPRPAQNSLTIQYTGAIWHASIYMTLEERRRYGTSPAADTYCLDYTILCQFCTPSLGAERLSALDDAYGAATR